MTRAVLLQIAQVLTVVSLAPLLLAGHAGGTVVFGGFALNAHTLSTGSRIAIGLLALDGFGAKLGLLPFCEWFPGAYGSGATGMILSGVILNAVFFALSRTLVDWLGLGGGVFALGVLITAAGALTSILAALYAFQ